MLGTTLVEKMNDETIQMTGVNDSDTEEEEKGEKKMDHLRIPTPKDAFEYLTERLHWTRSDLEAMNVGSLNGIIKTNFESIADDLIDLNKEEKINGILQAMEQTNRERDEELGAAKHDMYRQTSWESVGDVSPEP